MKQNRKGFFCGVISVLLLMGSITTATATVGQEAVLIDFNDIKVSLNGQELVLTDANGDSVEPFAINGTTYLPVRAIADALALEVGWDGETSTVTLDTPEEAKTVYITPTGKRWHYDDHCNGGTYIASNYGDALKRGLTPCDKCVLK